MCVCLQFFILKKNIIFGRLSRMLNLQDLFSVYWVAFLASTTQTMMKDQYANYVVQKILETSIHKHREILLSRIRVHLHALKKYTYGKHIVARFEQLAGPGESQANRSLLSIVNFLLSISYFLDNMKRINHQGKTRY